MHANTPQKKGGTSIYVHCHTHAQYYWYMPYTTHTHTHSHTDPAFPVTRQSWDTAVWEGAREGAEELREAGRGREGGERANRGNKGGRETE